MAHLVRHDLADFWKRALLKQIVIQRDPRRAKNSCDICAHPRGLPRSVHFKDLLYRNLVASRHGENRISDLGVRQRFIGVKQRLDKHRRDERDDENEDNRDDCSPDPPRSWCSPENSVEHNQHYRAANDRDAETGQLLPKPWQKGLGREAVLMFAKKVFIQIQRETQYENDHQIRQRVAGYLQRFEPGYSL